MAFGVEIYNSSGELILDTNTRATNIIISGSTTITTPSASSGGVYTANSANIDFIGLTPNNSSEYSFWSASNPASPSGTTTVSTITYNRFTDKFSITFKSVSPSVSVTVDYWGIRY
jgi:hypothetical protein